MADLYAREEYSKGMKDFITSQCQEYDSLIENNS